MQKYSNGHNSVHKFALAGALATSLVLAFTPLQAATSPQTFSLGGSIGDGPVIGADIFLYDRSGSLITSRVGTAAANYRLNVPGGTPYPVRIEAIRGTDLVTGTPLDFTLKSVALTSTQLQANLNPYSTLAVEMARGMTNGLNAANLAAATGILVREFNFGLLTSTVPDPMKTTISTQNIANIVRASEAVGEVVRRTRTALAQAGYAKTHNAIVLALAADLRDGRLNGIGAAPTDVRLSATANVVAAQVLVEGLQNRLYVNGTLATGAMDNAIRAVMPSTTAFTNTVVVPSAMLTQTKRLLTAVRKFDTRTQLSTLANIVNQIAAGSTTAQVRTRLTDSHSRLLDVSVTNIARAPLATLQAVNTAAGSTTTAVAQPATTTSNRAPTISGTPRFSIAAQTAYSFVPTAADADGDALRFSIANKPAWATFNTVNGALTGTPPSAGVFGNISIRVSDGTVSAALPAFTINVTAPTSANHAPTISGMPRFSVMARNAYSFVPTAADADGDTLRFSIANKPAWAAFNAATGALTGTPTAAGVFSNITIRVSDGNLSATFPAFTINVTPYTTSTTANRAPGISGTPPTAVNVGSAYSFAPTAVDMDGDTMTFSITNKPVWASFNTATGRLSGTPAAANVGTFGNIVIRVSDGTVSTALPAFSIRVNSTTQTTTGSVNLRWVAPVRRTDGTGISLSQISSYRIRYGTAPGSYTRSASNTDGDTRHTLTGLAAGTYYIVVTAIDSGGRESGYSNPVTARVQ